ncbi:diguanylate cyclase [Massilia sp. Mn16-1_5]|uniref:GGDEF domain-containing protein n=1 Tax=Massilia sp. Mn16-1_5 TaxID=2079199 RepID=UPI00109E4839|nr:GGDEF domain-containing protein [Massilia sp. Mn16-1_5]THC42486.1 GGDEF domain-containing protein [Massilia sp. Mn16-1_5]
MSQQAAPQGSRTGLFVNPAAARRAEFDAACGSLFSDLQLADGADAALALPGFERLDLLVIDLERFDPELDHADLARLVTARAGAPTFVVCPFANARWLPALMACGPIEYAIAPLEDEDLADAVRARLASGPTPAAVPSPRERELDALHTLRTQVRLALGGGEDLAALSERLCQALCSWPGVAHAALFYLQPGGDLQLQAQHGERGLNLAKVLGRGERLLQSPLRHAFPGLLAASANTIALLDDLDKSGEPALADKLREHGVHMVLALPIPSSGPGAPRGSLCLLFREARSFSRDELDTLAELSDLAAVGLRLADLNRESEEMLVRVTHLSTLDALTGIANRRHGETLLEQEIKRARRYKLPLALIAFDIDRFKGVNDRYGHPVGDMVLRTLTDAARKLVRASDVLVRAGGEEFQVIAPHTSAIDGLKMAEKLRTAIEGTAMPGVDQVTISLGVAQLGEHESADSLTVRVNAALARAKRAGRNCVELAMG